MQQLLRTAAALAAALIPSALWAQFPDASGYGADPFGDCELSKVKLYFVTNTNSSGSGSYSQAILDIRAEGSDTLKVIQFRTGGTTTASPPFLSTSSLQTKCFWIMGQTAPGDGFAVRENGGRAFGTERWGVRNGVIQAMRYRSDVGSNQDAVALANASDLLFDHVSASWGNDEVFSFSSDTENITVQNSIIGPGLRPHSTCSLIGSNGASVNTRLSFHLNLWTECAQRNPRTNAGTLIQFINNVVHSWFSRAGQTNYAASWDMIANYFHPGPESNETLIYRHDERGDGEGIFPSLYYSRNIVEGSLAIDSTDSQTPMHQWLKADGSTTSGNASWFRANPFSGSSAPTVPYVRLSAAEAFDTVLTYAGASWALNCDGTKRDIRDSLDTLLVHRVRNDLGPLDWDSEYPNGDADDPDDWGDHPTLASGTACTDSDNDGLFDEWETVHYGNTTTATATTACGAWIAIICFGTSRDDEGNRLDGGGGSPALGSRRRPFYRALSCTELDDFFCYPDMTGRTGPAVAVPNPARDSVIIVTTGTDSLTVGAGPMTWEDVATLCAAWATCDANRLQNMPIEGE